MNRDETGTKGAKLTGLIELSRNHLVYIHGMIMSVFQKISRNEKFRSNGERWHPHKDHEEGLIVRTAMEEQSEAIF